MAIDWKETAKPRRKKMKKWNRKTCAFVLSLLIFVIPLFSGCNESDDLNISVGPKVKSTSGKRMAGSGSHTPPVHS